MMNSHKVQYKSSFYTRNIIVRPPRYIGTNVIFYGKIKNFKCKCSLFEQWNCLETTFDTTQQPRLIKNKVQL